MKVQLRVGRDGTVEALHYPGIERLVSRLGSISSVDRISHVEWETIDGKSGWTVRSSRDPDFALRTSPGGILPLREGPIATYSTREDALRDELRFAWNLKDTTELRNV